MSSKVYDRFAACLSITPAELKELTGYLDQAGCTRGKVKKGVALGRQGEKANYLFLILSGQIRITICDSEGQEKTLAMHEKVILIGESGFFSQGTYNASMYAKTDVEFIRINRRQLERVICVYPALAWKIMDSMGKKLYLLTCEVAELSFYDIHTHLIEKLLNLAVENGEITASGEVIIRMRLTDGELAAMLASSREIITRHMGELVKQGMIRKENHLIVLTDISALRHWMQCRSWTDKSTTGEI